MKLRTFTQGAECNVQPRHFSQVKEHECCIPTTEIEEIAGGRLLPEPRKDAAALYFDENIEKGLEIDDISSMFHYGLKSYRGGLDPNTPAEGKHELKCGAFDGMLHDDEVPHLQPHMGLTNACEDYFLDFDLTKKVPELDYRFCEESGTEDSSESNTPAACNEAVGLAGLHIPEPDCQPDRFGKITASQIHGSSGTSSTCGCTLRVEDEMHLQCSASLKDYKMKQVSRATGSMESGYRREKNINIVRFRIPERMSWMPRDAEYDNIASSECEAEEKDMHDVFIGRFDGLRDVAPLLRQKRSRKPPQRYIEERTHSMSQNLKGRKQSSASSKKGKHPVLKSQNNRWHKGVKMALLVSHGGSPGRSPRPVPFLEHQDVSMRCLPKKEYSVKHPTKKKHRRSMVLLWILTRMMSMFLSILILRKEYPRRPVIGGSVTSYGLFQRW
ncbi:hypothetical protein Dimus_007150 [Dionaea muscipula]